MKSLLLLIPLLFSLPDKDLAIYRDLLHRSVNSSETAEFYYNKSKSIKSSGRPVLRGYKAMASFIMCKHVYNPLQKLSYFNRGKKELDAAILSEPGNLELIFLRFATQCNTPAFLGYNSHIADDKEKLLNYLGSELVDADKDLRNKIVKFMLQCKACSVTEKQQIKL